MTGTRHALAIALPLLVAPLCLSAEPDKYFPTDTTIVVHINVRQVFDSPLGKKYGPDLLKAALQQNSQMQKLLEALGVDALKDIDTLDVATSGVSADGAVLVAHGRIDPDRFHKTAEEAVRQNPSAFKIHKDGALTVYEGKRGNDPVFTAFPARDTLLISPSQAAVTAAAKGGKLRKDIAAIVDKVDGRQSV